MLRRIAINYLSMVFPCPINRSDGRWAIMFSGARVRLTSSGPGRAYGRVLMSNGHYLCPVWSQLSVRSLDPAMSDTQ